MYFVARRADSDNLRDLRVLADHVRDSDVLLIFLSKEVLHRPWQVQSTINRLLVALVDGPHTLAALLAGAVDIPARSSSKHTHASVPLSGARA